MHPATPGHHGTLQTAPNSFRMRTYTIGVRNPCRFRTYETGLPQVLWNAHLRTGGWGGWGLIVNLVRTGHIPDTSDRGTFLTLVGQGREARLLQPGGVICVRAHPPGSQVTIPRRGGARAVGVGRLAPSAGRLLEPPARFRGTLRELTCLSNRDGIAIDSR